jgi:hypothetical protein
VSFPVVNLNINLENLIDAVLADKIKDNDRDYSYFHASELAQCHRKLVYKYYEFKGYCSASEPNADLIKPRIQRIFDNGHSLHERLGDNLSKTKILKGCWTCIKCGFRVGDNEKLGIHLPSKCEDCGKETWRYREVGFRDDETMIGGHVDAVLDLRGLEINGSPISLNASDEESNIIVDFKSINSYSFKRLTSPLASHISQMQIYLYLTGLLAGKFLYENKDDQSFREFLVARDDNFITKIVSELISLKNIVLRTNSNGQHTLPPRAYKKDNTKECVSCSFRSHCWR